MINYKKSRRIGANVLVCLVPFVLTMILTGCGSKDIPSNGEGVKWVV